MDRRRFLQSTAAVGLYAASSNMALADWNPRRPLNIIVPYNAGGGTDTYARGISAAAQDVWPVPVVVVNRPGAGGITGALEAANARPDGNTILLHFSGDFVLRSLAGKTDLSPFESFQPIAQVGNVKACIAVPKDGPIQSLQDLADAAKANPGGLRWSHNGRGATFHVACQTFLNSQGLEATDVPFQGGAPSRAAIIGSQVDFGCLGIQQSVGFDDQLRVLAVLDHERDPLYPDVPTFAEAGFDVPVLSSPLILYAPLGVDAEIVSGIEEAVAGIADAPAFVEMLQARGVAPVYRTGSKAIEALQAMADAAAPVIAELSSN